METYDYQIIANLLSGKGLAKQKLEEVKGFLDKHRFSYRLQEIVKYTPISQIPENGKVKINKGVICLGGDGTVSETIGYMAKRDIDVPIFIVPTGTANFIATSIDVRTNNCYDKLLTGKIMKFDLGVCEAEDEAPSGLRPGYLLPSLRRERNPSEAENSSRSSTSLRLRFSAKEDKIHYFLIGIGFGFEQKFLELTKEKSKKFLGIISYLLAAFWELFKLRPLSYQLVLENQKINFQATMLSVLNFKPVISRLFPLFKEKDIKRDDGFLDIFYVEHKNYLTSFLGIIFFHLLGKYNFGLVKRIKTKKISVYSDKVQNTQIDGEVKGILPFKISIIKEGVKFLV